jgi:polyisoprenoid-binding protein YceI
MATHIPTADREVLQVEDARIPYRLVDRKDPTMETVTQQGATTAPDTRTTWAIDPAHSTIGFAIKHMMFTTVHGRFDGVRGTIRLDDDHPHNAAVEVEIDTASVDTGDAQRDEHLRSADFFDVATYPTIAFRSTRVDPASPLSRDRWRVIGDLTIHGVTRSVELTAEQTGRGTNPYGAAVPGFEATGKIGRKDFGMEFNIPLAEGGFLVGDEVKIAIDIEAVRQG